VHLSYAEAGCIRLNLLSNKAPFIKKNLKLFYLKELPFFFSLVIFLDTANCLFLLLPNFYSMFIFLDTDSAGHPSGWRAQWWSFAPFSPPRRHNGSRLHRRQGSDEVLRSSRTKGRLPNPLPHQNFSLSFQNQKLNCCGEGLGFLGQVGNSE
jgi:hypothetical protein